MSELSKLKAVIARICGDLSNFSLQLYRINKTKDQSRASVFNIDLPTEHVRTYVLTVLQDLDEALDTFEGAIEYNGESMDSRLSWAKTESKVVKTVWNSIANAEEKCERDWVDRALANKDAPKGMLLKYLAEETRVTFISDMPVVKQIKHAFLRSAARFDAVEGPLLVLPPTIDAIEMDGKIYFLSAKGINIFSLPYELSNSSGGVLERIQSSGKVGNADAFVEFARKGHNPKRLLRYDEQRLKHLAHKHDGEKLRKKFGISMKRGKIVTDSEDDVSRLIKVICHRGMLDPFNDDAVEVSGSIKWGK